MRIAVVVVLFFGLLVVGCEGFLYYYTYPKSQYRSLDMSSVSLGITESEVRGLLGPPGDVIGSRLYDGGHVVKVLQYLEAEFSYDFSQDRLNKNYYLYFLDDKLVQWGRPGDWQREADHIYELRLR